MCCKNAKNLCHETFLAHPWSGSETFFLRKIQKNVLKWMVKEEIFDGVGQILKSFQEPDIFKFNFSPLRMIQKCSIWS